MLAPLTLSALLLISLFLPIRKWIKKSLHLKYKATDIPYKDAADEFITDYDRENPVTKKDGEIRMIEMKEQKGENLTMTIKT